MLKFVLTDGREIILALPVGGSTHQHSYESTTISPACATRGYTLHTCSGCSDAYQTDIQPVSGHYFVSGACTVCGEAERTDNITPDTAWYTSAPDASAYTIRTAAELAGLAALVNGADGEAAVDFDGKTILLGNDIDLGSYEWVPIGAKNSPFKGNFDGDGHAILNLKMTAPVDYAGLFGYVTGQISNVFLEGVYINVPDATYVGAIVAYSKGRITEVTVGGYVAGFCYVGGVCGYLRPTATTGVLLDSITNTATVEGAVCAGGVVGYAEVNATEAYSYDVSSLSNTGHISGCDYAGGLIGMLGGTETTGCRVTLDDAANTGDVTSLLYAGGWIGYTALSSDTLIISGGTSDGQVFGESGFEDAYLNRG